ncbi:MAG: hypothetical protein A2W35_01970 [Chloroflexi bacterium RBG_16_57_11]|nr:MAG: hypothetical protein A2W35_01970 [Chloroflexi bacterium RBG_16_57_11]
MSDNQNDWVIVATFENESAADQAVAALKSWDKASDEIKLGAIGPIYKKGDKIKTQVGRQAGKGAKVGVVVGVIAAVLSGGVTLVGGVVSGGVLGGIAGAFFKKSLHLTTNEIQSIGAELDAGRVAVVVACNEAEAGPTSDQLTAAGGSVKRFMVPEELLSETAEAMETAAPEEAAEEGATTGTEQDKAS